MPIPGTLKRQNRPKLSDLSIRMRQSQVLSAKTRTKRERDTLGTGLSGPSIPGIDGLWVDLYFIKS